MIQKIYPLILSGGSGTRLWPLSRADYPKQFTALISEHPMIIDTLHRVSDDHFMPPTLICHYAHRFIVSQIMKQYNIKPRHIILEPVAQNTAAAIYTGCYDIYQQDHDAIIVILPCDHLIRGTDIFITALQYCQNVLQTKAKNHIACFAIPPLTAHTGYGYIEMGNMIDEHSYHIANFIEKPDYETACNLITHKNIGWNSGIFMASVKTILSEIKLHTPDIVKQCECAIQHATQDLDFTILNQQDYEKITPLPFDIAVMEKTQYAIAISYASSHSFSWSDMGSFSSLWQEKTHDDNGNHITGKVYHHDSHNNIIISDDKHIIATAGMEDMAIIIHDNNILVIPRNHEDYIKILATKANENPDERIKQYRPWGNYHSLIHGDGFLVKHITVYPGGRLSLQYHHHRAEHWIVVKGIATVTKNDETFILEANQSTYISKEETHRLENLGDDLLELIEVQTGNILEETDIVRLDDVYQR